jgi:hypothetical protein
MNGKFAAASLWLISVVNVLSAAEVSAALDSFQN